MTAAMAKCIVTAATGPEIPAIPALAAGILPFRLIRVVLAAPSEVRIARLTNRATRLFRYHGLVAGATTQSVGLLFHG
jgi:hypothetical protein